MVEISEEYANKPVVFIAVNSGTSKKSVTSYARQNNIPWPIIVDTDREFEKLCQLSKPISLRNIYQVRYITAEGEMKRGSFSKVAATTDKALEGASWRVSPIEIPELLRPAWMQIEFGNYRGAAAAILKARRSKDEDTKAGAQQLFKVVMGDMRSEAEAAWKTSKSGDRWTAYNELDRICNNYDGYPIPPKLVNMRDRIAKEPAIQNEIRAGKVLAAAQSMLALNNQRKSKTAYKRLRLLVDKFPDTLSAKQANTLLSEQSTNEENNDDADNKDDDE